MTIYREERAWLFAYTRKPSARDYPEGLAYSVHLAYSRDGADFLAFHQNYGILFAEAEISPEDTIVPKGVKNPRIFRLPGGGYGILTERTEEDGTPERERADADKTPERERADADKNPRRKSTGAGYALLWKTQDFREFEESVLLEIGSPEWEALEKLAEEQRREPRVVQGEQVTGSILEISSSFCDSIVRKWTQVYNIGLCLPESVTASSEEEVRTVRARAVYSDGSTVAKRVLWNTENIDFSVPGVYRVTGKVCSPRYDYPLLKGYGDPVVFPWEGKWYFLGTNDNQDDVGIYVREADSVEGLFREGTREHLILGVDEEKGFVQTFWAPEFHVIGGRLYILFAVGGKIWGPQCHMMRLKEGGRIVDPDSWEEPVKAVRRDGSPLSSSGITLDMTYLDAGERFYVVWSYRRGIGTSKDTGSMLYIAGIEEERPWRLSTEPVLLSRPLFGWENVSGTINNEGPHGFRKEGKVYLAYSGGSANSYTYALGLLTADGKEDLTNPAVWKKSSVPVLSFYSVKGEYGPGHHSFFTDEDGNLMIAYHGETSLESRLRCDAIRRVHFGIDGEPVFDMSPERDLNPVLEQAELRVEVADEQ